MASINFEALKQLNFDQLRDYYLRLSDRERYIVLASSIGGALILGLIIVTTCVGAISSMKRKIDDNRLVLAQIETLKRSYEASKRDVDKLEELINRTPPSFSLASHLESLAQTYNVQPDSMNPKPVPPNDLYAENQVEVRIPKVTLPALVDYLHKIENSEGFIRVNSLNMKPNYSDPAYLSVVFTVSVFTSKAAGGGR